MIKKYTQVFLGLLAASMLALPASANLLSDPSFEAVDTSGGDQGGAGFCNPGGTLGPWGCFNESFVSSQAILPPNGVDAENVVKQWGVDAGIFQNVAAVAGTTYNASINVASWNGDFLWGTGIFQLNFLDAGGGFLAGSETACSGDAGFGFSCTLAGVDGDEVDAWTELTLSGLAPVGTAFAQLQLLHINNQVNGPGGSAVFWDDASLTAIPVPGALLLMGPALLGLIGFGRKRA